MRKFIVSIALASATLSAVPASAQAWQLRQSVRSEIQRDINQLENRIDRAARRGTISPREANSLRRDASNVQRLYNRYSRNGLDRREVAELELRVNRVQQRLRLERRDWDGRRG
jgi:predicted RNase H-like nuclease (RuvC/YqgF family)